MVLVNTFWLMFYYTKTKILVVCLMQLTILGPIQSCTNPRNMKFTNSLVFHGTFFIFIYRASILYHICNIHKIMNIFNIQINPKPSFFTHCFQSKFHIRVFLEIIIQNTRRCTIKPLPSRNHLRYLKDNQKSYKPRA